VLSHALVYLIAGLRWEFIRPCFNKVMIPERMVLGLLFIDVYFFIYR
jgi:hypothetical protein